MRAARPSAGAPARRRRRGRSRPKYAPLVATEDYTQPVLPGQGASDYERYLRTDELLALQKTPEEQTHRDELLFQTVHQTSELWLKLACFEVETATQHLRDHELAAAIRL